MDVIRDIASWFFALWFVTIPLSIWIVKKVITELLDLILNTGRIDEMLKDSDILDIERLEREYAYQKELQSMLDISNSKEMKRQVDYYKLKSTKNNWRQYLALFGHDETIVLKKMSDLFRIDQ